MESKKVTSDFQDVPCAITPPSKSPNADSMSTKEMEEFTSPVKNDTDGHDEGSPRKLRPLAPKSLFPQKVKYTPLPQIKKSPHKIAPTIRPILPKPGCTSSPTKTAALILKKKATLVCQRKSPVKILPKRPKFDILPAPTFSRVFTRSQGNKGKASTPEDSAASKSCPQAVPSSKLSEPNSTSEVQKSSRSFTASAGKEEENVETDSEEKRHTEDREMNEDELHLMDLMAACTTIRYDPKKGTNTQDGGTKSKLQRRKNMYLAMLEDSILENDPRKDDRDTEFARDYFNRVKQVLQDHPEKFREFLVCLHEMNKEGENKDPVQLYHHIAAILHDHQDLVDDFAAFLLEHQAVECGCFVSYLHFQQIREFLRKIEISCSRPALFQSALKTISRWGTGNKEVPVSYKEQLQTALKYPPDILDEPMNYFLGGPFPDSLPDEFEDVDLEEAKSERVTGFEELTLPPGKETYNTSLCECVCHKDKSGERFHRAFRHCVSCSLKLLNGLPILRISKGEYQQLTLIYPQEEKEKLRKAKREAAQLALAKAKAQQSKAKRNKAKNYTQNGKVERLTFKRKRRKKSSKCEKPKSSTSDASTTKPTITTIAKDSDDFVPCGLVVKKVSAVTAQPDSSL